jgi:hypothetical protein
MNNHDRFAGVLGILPNQLIGLIREVKPEDKDAILKDLRLTSFWHGYRVWRQRAQLDREYWQDKVPNCFKGQPDVLDNCVNAFHYMKLVTFHYIEISKIQRERLLLVRAIAVPNSKCQERRGNFRSIERI